jgi:hypothetical protein
MTRQLYQKEFHELEDAKDWFYRRAQRLLDEGHGEDLSEEQQIRFSKLVAQFDVTARRLLQKADKDIQWYQPITDTSAKPQTSTDRERACLYLEAALKLRNLILNIRATISGENERNNF